ncbi:MAG: DUF1289 domain-containing protein [Novosphingobium sp.]
MLRPISPCISICRIDPATGWCLGCKRTLDEIADWPILNPQRQRQVLLRLKDREWPADQ